MMVYNGHSASTFEERDRPQQVLTFSEFFSTTLLDQADESAYGAEWADLCLVHLDVDVMGLLWFQISEGVCYTRYS
jgi:hypothetical protein